MARVKMTPNSLSSAQRNVLIALKERGEAGADEIAVALDITASAVRQHLAALRSAGYVAVRPSRGRPGRPVDLYHSTELGDAQFSVNDGSLTLELLEDLKAEDPALVGRVFRRREERRAHAFATALADLDLPERLQRLTELLDEEGYLTRWTRQDETTYVLSFNNCAIWTVAEQFSLACSSELDFLQEVLGDVAIKRIGHRRDGQFRCGYEIRTVTSAPH